MRYLAILSAAMMVTAPAWAADEFGARFGNSGSAALQDEAASVQNIEPAAGDETAPAPVIPPATTPPAETIDIKAPVQDKPIEAKPVEPAVPGDTTQIEGELEEKFDTEVSTTVQHNGDAVTEQHDSVGDGTVRAFYKSEKDGRVMDTKDAAGVEVKVLEFK